MAVLCWKENDGARQPDGVRWTAVDLDRCEHGRHSIDSCLGCPGGQSLGNPFVMKPETRIVDEELQVRIGSDRAGNPIWVTTHRRTPR